MTCQSARLWCHGKASCDALIHGLITCLTLTYRCKARSTPLSARGLSYSFVVAAAEAPEGASAGTHRTEFRKAAATNHPSVAPLLLSFTLIDESLRPPAAVDESATGNRDKQPRTLQPFTSKENLDEIVRT